MKSTQHSIQKLDPDQHFHIINFNNSEQTTISKLQRSKRGSGLITLISKEYSPKYKVIAPLDYTPTFGEENKR